MGKNMKKQLPLITNENGFYLPYVMFVSMVTFLVITTSILIYQNKIETAHTMSEFIEIETLIQMTKANFLNDQVYKTEDSGEIMYQYPNGEVELMFARIDENKFELNMILHTLNDLKLEKTFHVFI